MKTLNYILITAIICCFSTTILAQDTQPTTEKKVIPEIQIDEPDEPKIFDAEAITLDTETGKIHGTLLMPTNINAKEKVPVVLIHAGSGPTDRDGNSGAMMQNNSLKMMAESLAENKIASVRFDKRGIADSQEAAPKDESELTFETYIEDTKKWIDLLAKDERFSKVIVAGHSEGSLITLLASIDNPNVHSYISIAGPAESADVIIKTQLAQQPQMIQDMAYPVLDSLKNGLTVENPPPMLAALFRKSVLPYLTSWFKYEPKTEIQKLKIPVLILQGDNDLQVATVEADLLAAAKPDAQKVIVKDMNHVLKTTDLKDLEGQMPIYNDPELPINAEFIKSMVDFIENNGK